MVGEVPGHGIKPNTASARPASPTDARAARAADPNLRIIELPKPATDDRPIVNAMLESDIASLGSYITNASASEFGPQLHRLQALRLTIMRHVLSEICISEGFADLVSALPESEDGMRSAAFKISMRSAERANVEDPNMRDISRAHLMCFPASPERGQDDADSYVWMYGAKAPESIGAKHRQMLWEGQLGEEWMPMVSFFSVYEQYSRMRTSARHSSNPRFNALGDVIELLARREALGEEILLFASRGANVDEDARHNRWLGFDRLTALATLERAMSEVDSTHRAATWYRLASKSLIPPQAVGQVSGIAQAIRQIRQLLTGEADEAVPHRQDLARMSRDALARNEEGLSKAMQAYTAAPWPLGMEEAGEIVRAFSIYADEGTRSRAAGVFMAYARAELANLSRNDLLCSTKDRIAEMWAEAERMLRSISSSGAEPEHARHLCTHLGKLSGLLRDLGRTERELDSALGSLRAAVRRADDGGDLSFEDYGDAMVNLFGAARLRSAMLCQLRDAHACVRELKALDKPGALGGTASMLDTIAQLFRERAQCNFRHESDLLKEFEMLCAALHKAMPADTGLRRMQKQISDYRAHLGKLRGSAHEKAFSSALVRPKDAGATHVDPYAAHEAALKHLPTLLRQYMQYMVEREQSHSSYRQQLARPYYPPSTWIAPGNIAEYLQLRTDYYKARGTCRISVGGVPLVSLDRTVRDFLDRSTELNGKVISGLLEYGARHGEVAPVEDALRHAGFYRRRSQVLRDEYPSKKHYGAANEYPLDLHVEITEESGLVHARVERATANVRGEAIDFLAQPLEIFISEAELLEHFNERTYSVKTNDEVTLGSVVGTDIGRFRNDLRKLHKGIPLRAGTVNDLRRDPFAMMVADLRRQRALNGTIVVHDGALHERVPRVIGTINDVEMLSQYLFGGAKEARRAGNTLLRTYDEETRASYYRAFATALHARLPTWLMAELRAIEFPGTGNSASAGSY